MSLTGIIPTDLEGVLVKNAINSGSGAVALKNLLPNSGGYGGDVDTLPDNWGSAAESGATITVVGYGNSSVFDGAKYVDLQVVNSSGSDKNLTLELTTDSIAAVQNDQFAYSANLQLIAGTLAGNPRFMMVEYENATFKATTAPTTLSINSTMAKKTGVYTVSHADTNLFYPWLRFYDVPNASDFTVRITTPQVEKNSAVTSYQNTGY